MRIEGESANPTALNALRNLVGGILAGYGVSSYFCNAYLWFEWTHSAPRAPDPSRGLVFRHDDHGLITFLSGFQTTSLFVLTWSSLLIFGLGAAAVPRRKVISRRGIAKLERLSFKVNYERDDPRNVGEWAFLIGVIVAPALIYLVGPAVINGLNSVGFAPAF